MKKIVVGTLFVVATTLVAGVGYSTVDMSNKENKAPCTKCHVKPMKGDENLNAFGKCYKEKKDAKACETPPAK
jgi:hypothetical protein